MKQTPCCTYDEFRSMVDTLAQSIARRVCCSTDVPQFKQDFLVLCEKYRENVGRYADMHADVGMIMNSINRHVDPCQLENWVKNDKGVKTFHLVYDPTLPNDLIATVLRPGINFIDLITNMQVDDIRFAYDKEPKFWYASKFAAAGGLTWNYVPPMPDEINDVECARVLKNVQDALMQLTAMPSLKMLINFMQTHLHVTSVKDGKVQIYAVYFTKEFRQKHFV